MSSSFQSELTGSFSTPCDDNPTVAMVEAAYRHHGLSWRYVNAEVPPAGLAAAVAGARAMGWMGFNLSMPHKVAVIEHLDGLGESARLINAVNCVVNRDGRLIGENTDGKGFLSSLVPVCDPRGKHVMLLGAGGAARAIAVELVLAGVARLSIVNRSADRAEEFARIVRAAKPIEVSVAGWSGDVVVPGDVDVLVNCTSIGLGDATARVPVATASLRPGLVVADVIPNPPRTQLLAAAEAAGCTTLDGLGMLVGQGILGIKYWSGVEADARVMRAALEEAFA
ncbi:MAG: shikimate dehydrogenase [Planctomycetia bacterium]|nr:shikimate dehydrogenase [Planctomycetia bacterium]